MSEQEIQWSPESMLEVTIKQPDDFLKVRETLTRIGVASMIVTGKQGQLNFFNLFIC